MSNLSFISIEWTNKERNLLKEHVDSVWRVRGVICVNRSGKNRPKCALKGKRQTESRSCICRCAIWTLLQLPNHLRLTVLSSVVIGPSTIVVFYFKIRIKSAISRGIRKDESGTVEIARPRTRSLVRVVRTIVAEIAQFTHVDALETRFASELIRSSAVRVWFGSCEQVNRQLGVRVYFAWWRERKVVDRKLHIKRNAFNHNLQTNKINKIVSQIKKRKKNKNTWKLTSDSKLMSAKIHSNSNQSFKRVKATRNSLKQKRNKNHWVLSCSTISPLSHQLLFACKPSTRPKSRSNLFGINPGYST